MRGRIGIVSGFQRFNPEAGLTLTDSIAATINFSSITATHRGQSAVFACDITFPTTATDGLLFEYGGSGQGSFSGTRDSTGTRAFRVRAGDGAIALTASTTDAVMIDYLNYPLDGATRTVVWEYRVNPGRVRLWVDGVFIGEGNTTGGGALDANVWAGANAGGYGSSNTSVTVGEPITAWAGTLVSNLRFYANQLVNA